MLGLFIVLEVLSFIQLPLRIGNLPVHLVLLIFRTAWSKAYYLKAASLDFGIKITYFFWCVYCNYF